MTAFSLLYKYDGAPVDDHERACMLRAFQYHHGKIEVLTPVAGLTLFLHSCAWEPKPRSLAHGELNGVAVGRGELQLPLSGKEGAFKVEDILLEGTATGVIWSPESLALLTDRCSQRAVWYLDGGRYLLAGSEPRLILGHPAVSAEPDEQILAERVLNRPSTPCRSIYKNIQSLPPGGRLVSRDGVNKCDTWHAFQYKVDKNKSFTDWCEEIEHCTRDIMQEHIQQLNSDSFSLSLSGGLDSSVIAGFIKFYGADKNCLAATFGYPGMPCDESLFQDAVLAGGSFQRKVFDHRSLDVEADMLEPLRRSRIPPYRPEPLARDTYDWSAQNGFHYRFMGMGGDEFFAPHGETILDLLFTGQWDRIGTFMKRQGVAPALKRCVEHAPLWLVQLRRRSNLPGWVGSRLRDEFKAHRLVDFKRRLPGYNAKANERAYQLFETGALAINLESFEFLSADLQQDFINPFYDYRLAKKLLCVPEYRLISADDIRHLQRTSYAGFLPDAVRSRRGKVHFDYPLVAHLKEPWCESFFQSPRLEKEGWINGDSIRSMFNSMIRHPGWPASVDTLPPHATILWNLVGLELWLNSL